MGKIKNVLVAFAAAACPFLAAGSGASGQAVRTAALVCAGVFPSDGVQKTDEATGMSLYIAEPSAQTAETEPPTAEADASYDEDMRTEEPPSEGAAVISQSISDYIETIDIDAYTERSGAVLREHYGRSQAADHITLSSGAQVRNVTSVSNEELLAASELLPSLEIEFNSPEPQVLIVHTHTTESYAPSAEDWYDAGLPVRTKDSSRNMVAVGEAMAKSLAECGISVLHDGTIHDSPVYSGSYDRSEETIRAALAEYPSIRIVIDLHRDAIEEADGTRIAPVQTVGDKDAAQFMIIAGCDDGRFNMPDYMENFKLACLIQNSAEELFPGLARPILFDYRNYNQHITTGSLLIEVGSHGNSLDEALYSGELLGRALARAIEQMG